MDALVVIALIMWAVISFVGHGGKQKKAWEARRQTTINRPGGELPKPSEMRPMPSRPIYDEVHPGQTTLPTRLDDGETVMAYGTNSLGGWGEGVDPCHDDMYPPTFAPGQLAARAEEASPTAAQPVTIPGIHLAFNRDTVVTGVIFSEILNRRPARWARR